MAGESRKLQTSTDMSSAQVQPVHAVHKKLTPRQENKPPLKPKLMENSALGAVHHNIWQTSTVMSSLHAAIVKRLDTLLKFVSRKREKVVAILKVTATPAQEGIPIEDEKVEKDTDFYS